MDMNEKMIVKEELDGEVLTIEVEVKVRRFARDKKYSYNADDMLPILEKKYKIQKILKNEKIYNFVTKSMKNRGVWKYLLEEKKKVAKTTVRKNSTNKSIRDRMNKIAKNTNDSEE